MNFLHRLATTLQKKAYAQTEPVRMADVCNVEAVRGARVIDIPYRHVIIDDIFTKEFYGELCAYFNKKKAHGLHETRTPERFNAFMDVEKPYDGYVFSVTYQPDAPTNFFFSNEWNLYFSQLFSRPTDQTTAIGLHFHKKGDRTGWVHNDLALKSFNTKNVLANKVISVPYVTGEESDAVSKEGKKSTTFLSRRAITILYYLNNTTDEDVGGGTGMYDALESTEPAKIVAPKNNRLFAFEVSPKSYHAFQGNHTDRSSLAQWFHIDNEWCKKYFTK